MFWSLCYVSSARDGLGTAELHAILQVARHANALRGITGVLLYSKGSFVQVLEGPRSAVRSTYSRICRDPRHHDLLKLLEEETDRRQFATWAMAFRDVDDLPPGTQSTFADALIQWRHLPAAGPTAGNSLVLMEVLAQTMSAG